MENKINTNLNKVDIVLQAIELFKGEVSDFMCICIRCAIKDTLVLNNSSIESILDLTEVKNLIEDLTDSFTKDLKQIAQTYPGYIGDINIAWFYTTIENTIIRLECLNKLLIKYQYETIELTEIEEALVNKGNFVVRRNLLNDSTYTPYCGAYTINSITEGNGKVSCSLPRTKWNGEQFVCPECGYVTEFPEDFISYYKRKWNK